MQHLARNIADRRRTLGPGQIAWSGLGEPRGVENESTRDSVLLVAMAPNPNR